MNKIFNILKKSTLPIICILVLLVLEVQCDLILPEYTSKIINVGIQQNGIETAIPEAIRESKLNDVLRFATTNEKDIIMSSYDLITSDSNDYNKNIDKYPILKDENVYVLKNINKDEREKLDNTISTPLLISYFITSDASEIVAMRKQMMSDIPDNVDIMNVILSLPEEKILEMRASFDEVLNTIEPSLLKQMTPSIIKNEYTAVGIDVKAIQTNYIVIVGLKMIGIALGAMIIVITITYLSSRVGASFSRDLRVEITERVMEYSNKEFEEIGTASLITRTTNDIQQVQMLIIMAFRMILYAPLLGIGAFTHISSSPMSWIIGLAVATIFILVTVLLVIALPKFQILQKLIDKLNLISREIITGLPVIRAFAAEKREEERFDKANIDLTKTNLFVNRVMAIMMPTMMFIMNGVSILIIWVGAKYVDPGTMQVGTLMAFITYTMQIIMAFLMLTMISVFLPRSLVSIKRIAEIFNKDLSVKESNNPVKFKNDIKGEIEFKDVYFRYPDANEDVLEDINFKVQPGTITAFIGSTGSGKSTLINLIPRFFDVTSGKILIDGVNIKDVTFNDLRDKIGFVPQTGILFTGTVKSNIAFGEDKISKANIEKAAAIAQASDFIDKFEDKYDSSIAQGGTNVSGGQKQRLSIARAIAKDPEILIFDDSFSALDYKTDIKLRRALKKELKNRTVLIVASRIATILDADQIVVLDKGNIVGIGTHKELLLNNEIYKEIAYSQLSKEE